MASLPDNTNMSVIAKNEEYYNEENHKKHRSNIIWAKRELVKSNVSLDQET